MTAELPPIPPTSATSSPGQAADPRAAPPPPLPASGAAPRQEPWPDEAPLGDRAPRGSSLPPALQRFADQAWLNFQVWMPPLMNPPLKNREVVYWSREHREQGTWTISLPDVCCQCGAADGLKPVRHSFPIRAFESPLTILVGVASLLVFMLLLSALMGSKFLLILTLFLTACGAGLLTLKSWPEEVRVYAAACPRHVGQVAPPRAVIEPDELHLFLASEEVAAATREHLAAERRGFAAGKGQQGGATAGAGAPPSYRPAAPTGPPGAIPLDNAPPPPPSPYRRPEIPELPPIKLAGDDE